MLEMEPINNLKINCFRHDGQLIMNFSIPLFCHTLALNKTLFLKNHTTMETGAVIGFLVLCWWLLYLCVVVVSRQDAEWCCRLVTLIHGCIVTYLALRDIVLSHHILNIRYHMSLNQRQKIFLEISFSYFIFDITWMHIFGTETGLIWVHHITSLSLIFKMMYSNVGGPAVSYGLAGLEGTNPYLQTRWFLRTHGYNNTPLHTTVELWFIFLFVLLRVVGGTWLIYLVEINPVYDLVCKIACISVYVVSWLLVYQIIAYYKKKYMKGRADNLSLSGYSIFPYARQRRRLSNRARREQVDM